MRGGKQERGGKGRKGGEERTTEGTKREGGGGKSLDTERHPFTITLGQSVCALKYRINI